MNSPPKNRTNNPGSDTTVLIVEDDTDLREVDGFMCEPEFAVRTAADGDEALRKFGDHIDFALVDRQMPGLSGSDVVQAIHDRGYDTPVGFVSAVDPDNDPGVEYQTYLTKPASEDELLTAIRNHAAHSKESTPAHKPNTQI